MTVMLQGMAPPVTQEWAIPMIAYSGTRSATMSVSGIPSDRPTLMAAISAAA